MGIFDLFKSDPGSGKNPGSANSESSSSPEDHVNHSRKSQFYKFAFTFLPRQLFTHPEATLMNFTEGLEKGLESVLNMFNSTAGGVLSAEDISGCRISHHGNFQNNKEAITISFSSPDLSTGNLFPVFGPYHSAIIYSPENLKEVSYFVMCQSFQDGTSIREINAEGMNVNRGSGPQKSSGVTEFLKSIALLS